MISFLYAQGLRIDWVDDENPDSPQGRRLNRAAKKINSLDKAGVGTRGGRPAVAIETILKALLFRLREGCSWRALSIFAPHTTVYTRWKRWCETGIWEKILELLAKKAEGKLWAIDSTCVKAHKHAFGGGKAAQDQQIGKTRGGANTKIHALVDNRGRALRVILSPGNIHDVVTAPDLVQGLCARTILADKAYDADKFRQLLEQFGLNSCIPPKANRVTPAKYHKGHYRRRHHVENFFQRIKELRAIATRYEKLASRFFSFVQLAIICDWS